MIQTCSRCGRVLENSNRPMHTTPPLHEPDSSHLKAAQGWLELGNHVEADAELDKITAALREHPDVLDVRWQVLAKAKRWDDCYDLALVLTKMAPHRPSPWLYLSSALSYLGRATEAWQNLIEASARFPKDPSILYNLACYTCRWGKIDDARKLLEKAFQHGDAKALKLTALKW